MSATSVAVVVFYAGKSHLKQTCGRRCQVIFLKTYTFQQLRLIIQGIVERYTDLLHVYMFCILKLAWKFGPHLHTRWVGHRNPQTCKFG